ncbi:MAG: hypothetical protein ACMVY4_15985 [Minwuia sp.]|uniref:hypothetical protein n=1 Tax=Minwuia sp. TaxID=2493630 RepID=UPI003A87D6DE
MSTVDAPGNRREPVFDSVDVAPRRDADGHSDSPSLDRNTRIRAEMISEMIRESGQLRTSPFVLAAVLVMVFVDRAPLWPTILLIVGTIAFVGLGMRFRRAFETADLAPRDVEAWGLRYAMLSALVGLVWGPALAGYFDPSSYAHQAFLALLTIGSLFAAIMHRALYPPAFMALAIPTALPLIAQFALSGDRLGLMTAGIGAGRPAGTLRMAPNPAQAVQRILRPPLREHRPDRASGSRSSRSGDGASGGRGRGPDQVGVPRHDQP